MNRDDDFSLNDYLDGRLEPRDQHAIESSCVTDSRLAEELRELVVVRDLVAGLPRDQRVDLVTRVMERVRPPIGARRTLLWPRRQSALIATIGGGLAVAASVMAITTVFSTARRPVVPAEQVSQAHLTALADAPSAASPIDPVAHSVAPANSPLSADLAKPVAKLATTSKLASLDTLSKSTVPQDKAPSARTIEELSRLLDNRNLRQIFVVADSKDGSKQQRVASLVEQTTHFDYFSITVAQGIVIDPMHPDHATVFALIIDPAQLANLRDQLKAAVNSPLEEQEATPELITQLADLGDIRSFKPSVPAKVTIPREEMAFRESPGARSSTEPADAERDDMSNSLVRARADMPRSPVRHPTGTSPLRTANSQGLPPKRDAGQRNLDQLREFEDAHRFDPENSALVLIWICRPRTG